MAGTVAQDVTRFVYLIVDQNKHICFQVATGKFVLLVERRNALMHANPAKVGGEQRPVRHGTPW